MKGFIPRLGKKRAFKKRRNSYRGKRRVKRVRGYGNSRGGIRM